MSFFKRFLIALTATMIIMAYFGNQVWQQRFGEASSTEVFFVWLAGCVILAAFSVAIGNYKLVAVDDTESTAQKRNDRDLQQSSSTEKRKRDRLDRVLRDLTDDELHVLRQRLEDGYIDDDVLYSRITEAENDHMQQR